MIRIIILMVLSMLVSKVLWMVFYGSENEDKEEVVYYITATNGAIGCLSKDKFKEEQGYISAKNFKEAQRLLDDQECFFLAKGTKMFAAEGTCEKKDKDDALFPFKPNDFMMLQPYLPCSAVR